jgi:hypothetical protein
MDRHYFDLRKSVLHTVLTRSNSFFPGICGGVSDTPRESYTYINRIFSFSMTWAVAGKVGGEGLVLNAPI